MIEVVLPIWHFPGESTLPDKSQKSHPEISRIVLLAQGSTDRQSEVGGGEFHSVVMGQGGQSDQPARFMAQVPGFPMAGFAFCES